LIDLAYQICLHLKTVPLPIDLFLNNMFKIIFFFAVNPFRRAMRQLLSVA
jgi:hypothetical protein